MPRGPAWLVGVGDDRFDAAVVQSRLPVLVDIWAEWCGSFRAVAPIVERLALEHAGRLEVVKGGRGSLASCLGLARG